MARDHNDPAQAPATTPAFACLFFRHNPLVNMKCAFFTFKRPRDVKQHLLREHRLPLYCPTCGHFPFDSVVERDRHVQEEKCVPSEVYIEGLDPGQEAQLREYRARRNQDDVKTWEDYWGIVFPNYPSRPRALMSSIAEEVVDMINDHSNTQEMIHRNESVVSVSADQADLAWGDGRRYLEMVLSSFRLIAQNAAANRRTAPGSGPSLAATGHAETFNDHGIGPGLFHHDQAPYPYLGFDFGPQNYFNPPYQQ